jgi:hypothetical protein
MMVRPICCIADCDELAIGQVNAQWTVVDFDHWYVCGAHAERVFQAVARRKIDGQLPADMWTTLWVT